MASKYIRVPSPITFIDPDSGKELPEAKPVHLETFIRQSLMLDERWRSDLTWLRTQSAIYEVLGASANDLSKFAKVGSYLKLRVEEWEKLTEVAKAPRGGFQGYHPIVVHQLLGFIEAIVGALDEPPKVEEPAPSDESARKLEAVQ